MMRTTSTTAARCPAPRPVFRASRVVRAAAILAAGLLPLASLSAQPTPEKKDDPSKIEAPQPRPPSKPASTFASMMAALTLAALVIGVNFIPSKRGHQD